MPTLTQRSLLFVLIFPSALNLASCYPQLDPEVVLTPTAQRPLSSAAISSTRKTRNIKKKNRGHFIRVQEYQFWAAAEGSFT